MIKGGVKVLAIAVGVMVATVVILFQPRDMFRTQFERQREPCGVWGVVTTIFPPTPSLIRFLEVAPDACAVVVGDKKTSDQVWLDLMLQYSGRLTYLSAASQQTLPYSIMKLLRWNHFGRKNVGFMYAIHHGAEWVFDFDDDNAITASQEQFLQILNLHNSTQKVSVVDTGGHHLYNPYPHYMPLDDEGKPVHVWPRGFPLNFINDNQTWGKTRKRSPIAASGVSVLQSLADHDPDVDAIYRMTGRLPIYFERPDETVAVPPGIYSPWNAQAVLLHRSALWGLLLPVSVEGRVCDIWRSYIVTRLLWETDGTVAFASPFVIQHRNPHQYQKDFMEELDLYTKSGPLLDLLSAFQRYTDEKLDAAYRRLITLMHKGGFLGVEDVALMEAWISDLASTDFKWPACTRRNMAFTPRQEMIKDGRVSFVDTGEQPAVPAVHAQG